MSDQFAKHSPTFIVGAMETTVGPTEEGSPWTYEMFVAHVMKLDFVGRCQLSATFDRIAQEAHAAAAAQADTRRSDSVLSAEDVLATNERLLRDAERALHSVPNGADLRTRAAEIERWRTNAKHSQDEFLRASRELEPVRIELERLQLLRDEAQTAVDQAKERVAAAATNLATARARRAQTNTAAHAAE